MKAKAGQELAIQAYVKLVRTAEALHSQMSRELALEGLTASQFSAMKVLRLHGTMPQRDIAKYLLQTGGNITLVVDNLERSGLCQRVRDTNDRRLIFVNLTSKGETLFDRIYPGHLERIKKSMSHLSMSQLEVLMDTLSTLDSTEANVCLPSKNAELATRK